MRKFLSILFAVPVGIATYLGIKLALGQNPDDLLDPVLIGIVGLFPLVTCIFALDYETKWGFNPKVTLLVTTLGLPLFMLLRRDRIDVRQRGKNIRLRRPGRSVFPGGDASGRTDHRSHLCGRE